MSTRSRLIRSGKYLLHTITRQFHSYLKKSWAHYDKPNDIAINDRRIASTLVGTISNVLDKPFFQVIRSTNKEQMLDYFK